MFNNTSHYVQWTFFFFNALSYFSMLTATQQMEFVTHSRVASHSLSFTWLALCSRSHLCLDNLQILAPHPPPKTTLRPGQSPHK